MKQKFSTKWIGSKHPRKQRKYLFNAPLHLRRNFLGANLSKKLRKKYRIRNIELRKGDTVKIMRGQFKGKKGKITEIKTKLMKIYVDGITRKKIDGSKANVPLRASNLQITELNDEDKKRMKRLKIEKKSENVQKEKTKKPAKREEVREKKK